MDAGTRVGTVIENKYRLDEQIGQGGMGAVYRGVQLAVDRQVAIKLLHPNYVGHDKLQARFEVEAKAIARLNHPNCITLFDFGYAEELAAFYTVVEFIEGTSLEELAHQRPPISRVVEIVRQIASALGHAHHHGILHRDLKPENIMLSPMTDGSEIVKVLDFGIAQIMKGSDDTDDFETDRLTRVGEVFGTPAYMSPEQARSSRDLSPAADLYSLGVIFYELLEGRLPFAADNPVDILAKHLSAPPPPFTRTDITDNVRDIVMKMLEKTPEERPQSGSAVIALLDTLQPEDLPQKTSVRLPGSSRASEPTLIDNPDSEELLPLQSGEHRTLVDTNLDLHDELEKESKIFDLRDIVPEDQIPDGAPGSGLDAPPPAASVPPPNAKPATKPVTAKGPKVDRSTLVITEDDSFRVVRRDSRNKILFSLIALALVVALVTLVWWFNQDSDPAPSPSDSEVAAVPPPVDDPLADDTSDHQAPDDEEAHLVEEAREVSLVDDAPEESHEDQAEEADAPDRTATPRQQRQPPPSQAQESPRTIQLRPASEESSETSNEEEVRRPRSLPLDF